MSISEWRLSGGVSGGMSGGMSGGVSGGYERRYASMTSPLLAQRHEP